MTWSIWNGAGCDTESKWQYSQLPSARSAGFATSETKADGVSPGAPAHEKYEPSFPITSDDHGTPEEAFETSAQFL
jgi:hypothetical protein